MSAEIKKGRNLGLGFCLFDITGRVDCNNASMIGEVIVSKVDEGSRNVIVSLLDVKHMSIDGFRYLVRLDRKCRGLGGNVRLVCAEGSKVFRTISVLGLDTVFPVYPTEEEAIGSFSFSGKSA